MTKIQFTDPRRLLTIALPSFEGSEIHIYSELTTGQQRDIFSKFPNTKDDSQAYSALIETIALAIKDWNFTDANDIDLPITPEVIASMPMADIMHIAGEMNPEVKKRLSKGLPKEGSDDAEDKTSDQLSQG